MKEWDTRVRKQLGDACDVYQVAVLEEAPAFMRGMIKHAMRGSTAAGRQSHFVVIVKGEAELQKAAGYAEENDAYLLLLDGTGEIRWRTYGGANQTALNELGEKVKSLK